MVLAGAQPGAAEPEDLIGEVEELVASGMRLKDACAELAVGGVSKRELYEAVLDSRKSAEETLP